MKTRKGKRKRIRESFDAGHPVAEAIRSLLPDDSEMSQEARERMMGHLFSIQRRVSRRTETRARSRLRTAFVPAVAVLVVACVLVAVLLPLLLGGRKSQPSSGLARLVSTVGKVEARPPGGKWRAAADKERVGAGWSIRTGEGSLTDVAFPEGSIMRITESSEADLVSMVGQTVDVAHVAGGTYHRVHGGTRYLVTSSGVTSRALGTAFNIENRPPGDLEILSVEHAVEVEIGPHQPIKVAEGEVMTVSLKQGKNAVKQPVSRERLTEQRLCASVQSDAEAGYSTGIYEKLDVPIAQTQTSQPQQPVTSPSQIGLRGDGGDGGVSLQWTVSPGVDFSTLVLLRSALSEPEYPRDEIARYSDTSITSATDDSVARGRTYQYRLAALSGRGEVSTISNTVVISVPKTEPGPEPVSVILTATSGANGVTLEWSVSGATRFTGFVLERVVEKAPGGSATPAGSSSTRRLESTNVFYTFRDNSVVAGHTYTYRVGLVVEGSVMVYSNPRTLEVVKP